jgi:hypothetical protein
MKLFWLERYSQMYKLGTIAWIKAQPLKDFEKVVIHPYIMLSAL